MSHELNAQELEDRKELARYLLDRERTPLDDELIVDPTLIPVGGGLAADLNIPFPAGLAPIPEPIDPAPDPDARLPRCDVVVITWTQAENDALADVLTPGYERRRWYRYRRNFGTHFEPQIRAGAPAKRARRLGSYFPTRIGDQKVICFKSELHLNQDGIENEPGKATLPVKDLFQQIIEDCRPSVVLTVGTCGAIDRRHDLGDTLVTRAARFRCQREFKNAAYNNQTFTSDWTIPTGRFDKAEELMDLFAGRLTEPTFGPPTKRHTGEWKLANPYRPRIVHEAGGSARTRIPEFHPILSTDFFEFGTSANEAELIAIGCGLEMGDAALGLACAELADPPRWAVLRNLSDPQIAGDLTSSPRALNMQAHWAVWYYEAYGYWTSVMSSLATWAIIAEL